MQPWAVTPGELDLCMIEARYENGTTNWGFRCRRVWEGGWVSIESSLELVRKADCSEAEFAERFPDCIPAVPVASGENVIVLSQCA